MALSDTSHQILWMWSLLEEIGYSLKAIPLNGDNQGAIFMASNPVQEKRIKHVDICYTSFVKWLRTERLLSITVKAPWGLSCWCAFKFGFQGTSYSVSLWVKTITSLDLEVDKQGT
jgi:hypothetical protein